MDPASTPTATSEVTSAPSTIETTTQTPTAETTPVQTTTASAPVTTSAGDQTTTTATQSDSFTTFDPSQLTDPNLQAAYKQMQADYTNKTKELAETRSKYDRYVPVIDEMLSAKPDQSAHPLIAGLEKQLKEAGYDESSIDVGKMIAKNILDYTAQEKQVEQTQQKVVSEFASAVKADPRLEDQSLVYDLGDGTKASFGEIVENLVASNPNWRQNPQAAIQRATKVIDAMINTAKTQGKQELSKQTQQKTQSFAPVQTSPQGAAQDDRQMSVREAFEAARAEMGNA